MHCNAETRLNSTKKVISPHLLVTYFWPTPHPFPLWGRLTADAVYAPIYQQQPLTPPPGTISATTMTTPDSSILHAMRASLKSKTIFQTASLYSIRPWYVCRPLTSSPSPRTGAFGDQTRRRDVCAYSNWAYPPARFIHGSNPVEGGWLEVLQDRTRLKRGFHLFQ